MVNNKTTVTEVMNTIYQIDSILKIYKDYLLSREVK